MTTNHQYPGLAAARTVKTRPSEHVARSMVPPPEAVGQPGQGQGTERGQAQDGEPDPEHGPRQSGLIGDGRAVDHMAEVLGDVAQGGDGAALPEPRGEGHEGQGHDGGVAPRAQPQVACEEPVAHVPLALLPVARRDPFYTPSFDGMGTPRRWCRGTDPSGTSGGAPRRLRPPPGGSEKLVPRVPRPTVAP